MCQLTEAGGQGCGSLFIIYESESSLSKKYRTGSGYRGFQKRNFKSSLIFVSLYTILNCWQGRCSSSGKKMLMLKTVLRIRILDLDFFPSQISDPERGVNKVADPESGSAKLVKNFFFKTIFIKIKGHLLNTWILIRIRIQQFNDSGSFPTQGPQPCSQGPRYVGFFMAVCQLFV